MSYYGGGGPPPYHPYQQGVPGYNGYSGGMPPYQGQSHGNYGSYGMQQAPHGHYGADYYQQGHPNYQYHPQQQQQQQHPHLNPKFLQGDQGKVLRSPYPTTEDAGDGKQKEDMYDPSCPTISQAEPSNFPVDELNYSKVGHQQQSSLRQNNSSTSSASVSIVSQPVLESVAQQKQHSHHTQSSITQQLSQQSQPAVPMNSNNSFGQSKQTQQFNPITNVHANSYENLSSNSSVMTTATTNSSTSSIKIMTGIVTQIQPGGFGMISEEIFFQQSAVSGSMPNVGDKVVVEAEAVLGMPFKYNAKRVTKLDIDLEEQHHKAPATQQVNTNMERVAPLPTLPDSLNLPAPAIKPPLKSILKRNPPPPPVLSKGGSSKVKPHIEDNSSSTFKSTPSIGSSSFSIDLDRNIPSVLPPSGGPPIEFAEYTFINDRMPRTAPIPSPRASSPQITRLLPASPVIKYTEHIPTPATRPDLSPTMKEILSAYGSGTLGQRRSPIIRRTRSRSRSLSPSSKRSRKRNRSKSRTPTRTSKLRSRSRSPKRKVRSRTPDRGRRSRSRSLTRRSQRRHSRSRSRDRRRSRSATPPLPYRRVPPPRSRSRSRERRRSRSISPRSHMNSSVSRDRRRSRSISPGSRRNRLRSISPRSRRNRSRSCSRDRSRRSSKSSQHKKRSSSNSNQSLSPIHSSGLNVYGEVVTHGIVTKKVVSDLFLNVDRNRDTPELITRKCTVAAELSKSAPVPVKFQIANPAKPVAVATSSLVPNPSFKAVTTPQHNASKIANFEATKVSQPKKKKEQEPAFKIIEKQPPVKRVDINPLPKSTSQGQLATPVATGTDGKIKQGQAQTQKSVAAPVLKTVATGKPSVLPPNSHEPTTTTIIPAKPAVAHTSAKDTLDIFQLKQTIQNDLSELRQINQVATAKKPVETVNVELLKQTVQRDLSTLRNNNSDAPNSSKAGSQVCQIVFDVDKIKESVNEGLKNLRSQFDAKQKVTPNEKEKPTVIVDVENKNRKTPTQSNHPKDVVPTSSSSKVASNSNEDKTKTTAVTKTASSSTTNNKPSTSAQINKDNKGNSKDPPKKETIPPTKKSNSSTKASTSTSSNRTDSEEIPEFDEELELIQQEIHQQRFMEEQTRLRNIGDEDGLRNLFYMEDRRRRRLDEKQLARLRVTEIKLKKDKNFSELQKLREQWGPPAIRLDHERRLRDERLAEERQRHDGETKAIRRHEADYQQWLEDEAKARRRERKDQERANRGMEGRVLRRRISPPSDRSRKRGHNEDDRSGPGPHDGWDGWDQGSGPPPSHPHPMDIGPPPNHPDFFDGPPGPQFLDERFEFEREMHERARMEEEMMHREMEMRHRMEMDGVFHGHGPPQHNTRFVTRR